MRWDESHDSPDVIDRRGEGGGGGGVAANAGMLYLVFWLLRRPWGWAVLLVLGIGYFAYSRLAPSDDSQGLHSGTGRPESAAESAEVHFVSFVLDDVQQTWERVLPSSPSAQGRPYRHAKLVLYTDSTATACGEGSTATGPFYCPGDERVYLDLGFFHELSGKLGARGQFAQAYVVAHEVGHHVQKILGLSNSVGRARGETSGSVRLELQADCFAGVWAHSTGQRNILEAGDIDSALSAAAAVGDDRLQRMATGTVRPESWTHGSSEERKRWFSRGYTVGTIEACDTFHATQL